MREMAEGDEGTVTELEAAVKYADCKIVQNVFY
jgi:hypothetical protein